MASFNGTDVDEKLIIGITVSGTIIVIGIIILIVVIVVIAVCWVSNIHIYINVLILKQNFVPSKLEYKEKRKFN